MHGGSCESFRSIPVHRPLPQLWGHLKRFGWACSPSPQSLPWQLLTAPLPPAAPLFIPQLPGNQGVKTGDLQGSHSRFECKDFTEKLLLLSPCLLLPGLPGINSRHHPLFIGVQPSVSSKGDRKKDVVSTSLACLPINF